MFRPLNEIIDELMESINLTTTKGQKMTKTPDNPRVFPKITLSNGALDMEGSMSLRDYFAGQALQKAYWDEADKSNTAKYCYQMADAMLKQREAEQ